MIDNKQTIEEFLAAGGVIEEIPPVPYKPDRACFRTSNTVFTAIGTPGDSYEEEND